MAAPLMYVRFAFGVVGETRRTIHLVPAPEPDGQRVSVADYAGVLIALCGQSFAPGERELLAMLTGEIEIDSWPLIPPYVEIEATTRDQVVEMAARLGFDEHQLTGENTTKVYARYGIDLTQIRELRFPE